VYYLKKKKWYREKESKDAAWRRHQRRCSIGKGNSTTPVTFLIVFVSKVNIIN